MRITGERVTAPDAGFNPAWQRHSAIYALSEPFLGPGRVLDLGCGVGHSFHLLGARETVGVDISADALVGQRRQTVVADMRALPFDDDSFPSVIASHSVEHVPDPERALAETARVLEPGSHSVAVFFTPNRLTFGRPDEIIDPYHFIEFDPEQLKALCSLWFDEVSILGLFGSPRYMKLFREERVTLDRILARDRLRLRQLVPIRVKQRLYDHMLARNRSDDDPRAAAIEAADFELRETDLNDALDLCAVCRVPRG